MPGVPPMHKHATSEYIAIKLYHRYFIIIVPTYFYINIKVKSLSLYYKPLITLSLERPNHHIKESLFYTISCSIKYTSNENFVKSMVETRELELE